MITASFSFVDHYQILHEKDLAFSREHLNGDDKENQAQPKKKPRKVSGDRHDSRLVIRAFRVFERARTLVTMLVVSLSIGLLEHSGFNARLSNGCYQRNDLP